MTTLVAGSTRLAGQVGNAIAHGEPEGCSRMYERDARLLMDGRATEPTLAGVRTALREHSIQVVIDANDPFVEGISATLEAAASDLGIPHRRVVPASFEEHPDAGRWRWVDTLRDAAAAAWQGAGMPVVALKPIDLCAGLGSNAGRVGVAYRQRVSGKPFPQWLREPSARARVTGEAVALLMEESARVLLTNDSGDPRVQVFLDASLLTGTEVVMLRRPSRWRGLDGSGAVARDVLGALRWRNAVL